MKLDAVAAWFGIHIRTVRKWCSASSTPRLETVKLGGLVVTTKEALQRFGDHRQDSAAATNAGRNVEHDEALRNLQERHGFRNCRNVAQSKEVIEVSLLQS